MQGLLLKENHPLVADITMAVSLGTLPMVLEINATSCGSTDSVLAKQRPSGAELDREFSPLYIFFESLLLRKAVTVSLILFSELNYALYLTSIWTFFHSLFMFLPRSPIWRDLECV